MVLEGEGLANDATALILYRFAVRGGHDRRVLAAAGGRHLRLIVVGEIFYGIGVGWLSLRLRQWAHNPRVEITLSLMTPYLAYWIPEHLGGSGVLATVAAGLYVSWNGPRLIPAATRLQGIFFWDLIIYLIEGFVFLITGLQARTLIEKAHDFPVGELLVVHRDHRRHRRSSRASSGCFRRPICRAGSSRRSARRDPSPPWQQAFVLAFTGVRGVVSLAAALAIPLTIESGAPFPHRDLILFVTFGVIIITLVGQGLMLPTVIRWLGVGRHGKAEHRREQEAELAARNEAIQRVAAASQEARQRAQAQRRDRRIPQRAPRPPRAADPERSRRRARRDARSSNNVRLELIAAERDFLYELLRDGKITDESRRRLERDLDLEEAAILARREGETPL